MNKTITVSTAAGVITGALLMWLFAPWGIEGGPGLMMRSRAGNGLPRTDAHFIEQMIPHHEDAINMAEVVLEKGGRPEIQELAKDIQAAQQQEIHEMQEWYQNWFGAAVPDVFSGTGHPKGSGGMHMGMMGGAQDVRSLEEASDVDKAFIEEMIPHHQMAVMMAQMLLQTTERAEMKELAKNIIEAQNREIESMRGWYADWYGDL